MKPEHFGGRNVAKNSWIRRDGAKRHWRAGTEETDKWIIS